MGMFDRISSFFKGLNKTPDVKKDDKYEDYMKSKLASEIIDLVDQIKRINSFDSSIWNLNNISSNQLERRGLAELERLHSSLNNRLLELTKQSERSSLRRQELEESKWSGQKPRNLTDHEFDRFQRDDER